MADPYASLVSSGTPAQGAPQAAPTVQPTVQPVAQPVAAKLSPEEEQAIVNAGYNPYDPASMEKFHQIQATVQKPMQTSLGSRIGTMAAGMAASTPLLGPAVSAIANLIAGKADTIKNAAIGNDPTGEKAATFEAGKKTGILASLVLGGGAAAATRHRALCARCG